MPNTATVREQRRRKTKAQLIDELETLEKRSAANEAPHGSGSPVYDSDDRLLQCRAAHQQRVTQAAASDPGGAELPTCEGDPRL